MNFNFDGSRVFFTSDTHFNHDLKNMRQGFIGHKDVWQLFGHVHSRKNNSGIDADRLQYLYPTQYDVVVDNNDYTPVSFEQVKRIIENQILLCNMLNIS